MVAKPTLPERIKQLRKLAGGLSQQKFADALGVGKSTVSFWENGRSKPLLEHMEAIYNVFGVDANFIVHGFSDSLAGFNRKLASVEYLNLDVVHEPQPEYARRGTTLVPISAQAGYSEGGQIRDDLPIVIIPGIQDQNSRVFEVSGDSMDPVLNHRDYIAAKKLEDAQQLRDGLIYVVVSRNHGVTVKYVRLTLDALRCTPHNTHHYNAFNVPLDEVIELWEVQARITRNVLGNVIESIPARIQNRFERLERVMDNLLSERDRPK